MRGRWNAAENEMNLKMENKNIRFNNNHPTVIVDSASSV
jgi:hypothetical protein